MSKIVLINNKTIYAIIACIAMVIACTNEPPIKERVIEVEPNIFVAIKRQAHTYEYNHAIRPEREWIRIIIPNQPKPIDWTTKHMMLLLRRYKEIYYVVVLDRSNLDMVRFRYYRQAGEALDEIKYTQFPPAIAIDNINLDDRIIEQLKDGTIVDEVYLAKTADPSNKYFRRTTTAALWHQLMTGQEYYEFMGSFKPGPDLETIKEFKRKYNPPLLTKIR